MYLTKIFLREDSEERSCVLHDVRDDICETKEMVTDGLPKPKIGGFAMPKIVNSVPSR